MLEPMEINGQYFLGVNTCIGFRVMWGWADLASFGVDLKRWVDFYNEHRSEIPATILEAFKEE